MKTETNITEKKLAAKPPAWISDHAKTVWTSTHRDLARMGKPLLAIHHETLLAYCEACDLVRTSSAALRTEGFLVEAGRDGFRRHPAASTLISALTSVKTLASSLGLTPATWRKLPQPESDNEPNPFADL
jgi:P27 family predicted phage terminase small subunit